MTDDTFKIEINFGLYFPLTVETLVSITLGIFMICIGLSFAPFVVAGSGVILVTIRHYMKRVNAFILSEIDLIIKRPFSPFKQPFFSFPGREVRFPFSDISAVKFVELSGGMYGGPHLQVIVGTETQSFMIQATKSKIDEFEIELKKMGVRTINESNARQACDS